MIYFTYHPSKRRAWFSDSLPTGAISIANRVASTVTMGLLDQEDVTTPVIPSLHSPDGTPLLKSNLQKAIRRGETDIAVQTAILLLQRDPTEMLRRLPIIAVEDVALIDSFPVMTWLMMAGSAYRLTTHDIDILLHIVWTLSETSSAIDYEKCWEPLTPTKEMDDVLRSVYYRWKYGGMKGDLALLAGVSRHHSGERSQSIFPTWFGKIDYRSIEPDPVILLEAVDFHPFPKMLALLSRETDFSPDVIREWIWNAESAFNIRKPSTHRLSEYYRGTAEWSAIEPALNDIRLSFL